MGRRAVGGEAYHTTAWLEPHFLGLLSPKDAGRIPFDFFHYGPESFLGLDQFVSSLDQIPVLVVERPCIMPHGVSDSGYAVVDPFRFIIKARI